MTRAEQRAAVAWSTAFHAIMNKHGVGRAVHAALYRWVIKEGLEERPIELSAKQLADLGGCGHGTVSRALPSLIQAGLVEKVRHGAYRLTDLVPRI